MVLCFHHVMVKFNLRRRDFFTLLFHLAAVLFFKEIYVCVEIKNILCLLVFYSRGLTYYLSVSLYTNLPTLLSV